MPWGHGKVLRVYKWSLDAMCVEFFSLEVLGHLVCRVLELIEMKRDGERVDSMQNK